MKTPISYNLRKLTEKEYADAPEEVRKVYIHVVKKVPLDAKEKARILAAHPYYFTRAAPRTFGQRVKKMYNQPSKKKRL